MKRRQGEKYKKIKPEQEVFPVFWRIVIIAYILLMLYSLFKYGGNGADWYPGKPIYLR